MKNFGKPLSKEEQKQIRGGIAQCSELQWVWCDTGCYQLPLGFGPPITPANYCANYYNDMAASPECYIDSVCEDPA